MPQVFVDGHVHIHSSFNLEHLFTCAKGNFDAIEATTGEVESARFLLLTESTGMDVFATLQQEASSRGPSTKKLHVEKTEEENSLRVIFSHGAGVYLVAGRQIVTKERLEVLALGWQGPYPDGTPIAQVLNDLTARPCLTVLPWGVGKWFGKRGQLVQELVSTASQQVFFLGDNANRPFFWPLPALFKLAQEKKIRNIPGSDPLPFARQEDKVGSFGCSLAGDINPQKPFASLQNLMMEPGTVLYPYGRLEGLIPFLKHQLLMQLKKK